MTKVEHLEKFPGEPGDAAETIVNWFMPMMGWRNYLSPLQCARIAAGLRTLAAEFEDYADDDDARSSGKKHRRYDKRNGV